MLCPKCGAQLSDSAVICRACGAMLPEQPVAPKAPYPPAFGKVFHSGQWP